MKRIIFVALSVLLLSLPFACSKPQPSTEEPTNTEPAPTDSNSEPNPQTEGSNDGGSTESPTPDTSQPEPDQPDTPTPEPNPNVGKIKWSVDFSGYIKTPALSKDEKILYITVPRNLIAVNVENGDELWRMANLGNELSAPVVDAQGNIIVGSEDKRLFAIHPTQRKWVWAFSLPDAGHNNAPAIGSDGTIFISAGKVLHAVENGKAKWTAQYSQLDEATSPPSVASDGTVYVCTKDNKIHAVKPDGTEKWIKSTGSEPCVGITIDSDGTIYAGAGALYAYNPDGSSKWTPQTQYGAITTAVTIHQQFLYFGTFTGKLYKVNKSDGKKATGPRWDEGITITISGSVDFAPTIGSTGIIYLGDPRPSFEAYSPFNAQTQWSLGSISRSAFTGYPAIDKSGILYIGTANGTLFAVNSESNGLANSPWPRGSQNNQSTKTQP